MSSKRAKRNSNAFKSKQRQKNFLKNMRNRRQQKLQELQEKEMSA